MSEKPYKMLSLFDGSGGFCLAGKMCDIEPTMASEIEPYPIRVTTKRFPKMKHLGDISKINGADIEPVDLITFGSPCFVAGTPINTQRGYIPIEQVRKGDLVMTHKNRWRKVTDTMNSRTLSVFEIKLLGNPLITATGNHPFWTRETVNSHGKEKLGPAKWKPCEELMRGDYIGFAIDTRSENEHNLSEEDCRIIGEYVSGESVGDVDERLKELCEQCEKEEHRHLNDYILRLPKNLLKIVLDGYFGAFNESKEIAEYWTTIKGKAYAYSLQQAVAKVYGVMGEIYCSEKKESYDFIFSMEEQSGGIYEDGMLWVPFRGKKEVHNHATVYNITVEEDHSYTVGNIIVKNCQNLSVAGNRKGLAGEQSGLFLEAVRVIREMREATNGRYPTYIIWENVVGAFSSNSGEDFKRVLKEIESIAAGKEIHVPRPKDGHWLPAGSILGDGYSIAWRTFDAQYWGVPQRRARIYLVADFRGERAEEILFKRDGLQRDFKACREAWEDFATDVDRCIGTNGGRRDGIGFDGYNEDIAGDVSSTLGVNCGMSSGRCGVILGNYLRQTPISPNETSPCVEAQPSVGICEESAGFCTEHSEKSRGIGYEPETSPTLRAGVIPAVLQKCLAFEPGACSRVGGHCDEEIAPTLRAHMGDNQVAVVHEPIAFSQNQREEVRLLGDKAGAVSANAGSHQQTYIADPRVMAIENHPMDSRVKVDESGKCQTLTRRMGTGGGNVPLVMEAVRLPNEKDVVAIDQQGGKGSANFGENVMPTLCSNSHGTPHAVVYLKGAKEECLQCIIKKATESENLTPTEQEEKEILCTATQQGGAEMYENLCPTITASAGMSGNNQPFICYSIPKCFAFDSLASNSMKSENPNSGCNEVYKAKTLDTSNQNPSKNQGEICVVQECFSIGNGQADSTKLNKEIMGCLNCMHDQQAVLIKQAPCGYREGGFAEYVEEDKAGTLKAVGGAYGGGSETILVESPCICIQSNIISRGVNAGANGKGWKEDQCFTLTTADNHAVAYVLTTGSFMSISDEDKAACLMARDFKDPQCIVQPKICLPSGKFVANQTEQDRQYIVRRITPKECCRLQGFPDWWESGLETPDPSEEEITFWREVFETYRNIMGGTKEKTDNQIKKWLAAPYGDAASYKMWGNGIALPTALYVVEGIAEALKAEGSDVG